MSNEELMRDFGPFRDEGSDKPWALGRMEVMDRTRKAKESTITVFGSGAKTVLGHRTDWTICDDVVTEKNSATPTQRGGIREWFDLSVETGPEFEDSRLTVVGTLFHPEDLYNDLMVMVDPEDGLPIWHVQREDAVVEMCSCGVPVAEHPVEKCSGPYLDDMAHATLWPARWPWKRLMRQKAKVGTLNFNKRYRNIAVDPSRMIFREEYVKGGYIGTLKYPGCLDKNHIVGSYEDSWLKYAGFDPAVGTAHSAKFCAHMTLAVGSCAKHERCLWVIDLIRDQLTLPQQVETIIKQHERYDCFTTRVEANSYQMGLYQAIKQKLKEQGLTQKIEPHYTNRANKHDPEIGIQALAPVFENGEIHIPWGNPESQRKMKDFVDELVMYPDARTTDTVMAAWFAWLAADESAPKFKSFNRLRSPRMTEWGKRTSRRTIPNPYYVK
jgi:predicted phage terminase large subunit-like protein